MFETQAAFRVVDDVEPMRRVTVNPLHGIGAASILTAVNGSEALRMPINNQGAVPAVLGTYSAHWLTEAQRGSIRLKVSDADDTTEINERLPEFVT